MWLPRLMRAANEEQEHRAAVGLPGHAAQNLFGTLVTCDCGHLASCRRTAPLVCSRNDTQALKHRFTLVKWCCIAFLLLIFTLIAFSGLLTSTPSELTSGSSYLFLTIIITSLLLFGGLCCLRARTICRNRNVRHGSLHCRRGHYQSHSLRLPVSLFAQTAYSRSHVHSSPNSLRFSESPFYNALLEACTAPLPTYNEAIKEPVFAPPAYSAVIAPSSATPINPVNEAGTHHISTSVSSSAGNERIGESISSSSSSSKQELLVQPQPNVVETVTSVEIHHTDETENEVAQAREDKSSDE
uniref:Transmembrane protein n=1 Tax=Elaeophora elaphi TaxID=1147741 RepID=A0A0R3RUZ6_9BILA